MQQGHLNILDTLRRVQGFLDTQATALGTLVPAALRARLDDTATQLSGFQVEQASATGTARGETANQAQLRKDFFTRFMRPIAKNARASLKNVGEYPTMVVPSSKLRKGEFLGAAQALADSAAKYEKTLVAHGMATDFLTQLRAAIAQLSTSNDARNRNLSRREAATEGIKNTSTTARNVLVNLDAIIGPALKHNTPLLADWKASKRILSPTPLPPQPTGLPVTSSGTEATAGPSAGETPSTAGSPAVTGTSVGTTSAGPVPAPAEAHAAAPRATKPAVPPAPQTVTPAV